MKRLLMVPFILLTALASQGQPCTERAIVRSDTIVLTPEKPAYPEKGLELYMGWIANHRDPKLRRSEQEVKKVYISIIVDEHGQLSDFEVVKGVGAPYDHETIELIKKHPHKWVPAQCRTKKVKTRVVLPIRL